MELLEGLFGRSRDQVWAKLSASIGADFHAGGFFHSGKVELTHGGWHITLDQYVMGGTGSVTYTRIRAPYLCNDAFQFNVYRQNWLSPAGLALLGATDIVIGDPVFDKRLVVRSSSEPKVRRLLANTRIRSLLETDPDVHFQSERADVWSNNLHAWQLRFETLGVIRDVERLRRLFDLFCAVLDALVAIGSAAAPIDPMEATPDAAQMP